MGGRAIGRAREGGERRWQGRVSVGGGRGSGGVGGGGGEADGGRGVDRGGSSCSGESNMGKVKWAK